MLDALVIGGGINGSWTALHLLKRHQNVVLIDQVWYNLYNLCHSNTLRTRLNSKLVYLCYLLLIYIIVREITVKRSSFHPLWAAITINIALFVYSFLNECDNASLFNYSFRCRTRAEVRMGKVEGFEKLIPNHFWLKWCMMPTSNGIVWKKKTVFN